MTKRHMRTGQGVKALYKSKPMFKATGVPTQGSQPMQDQKVATSPTKGFIANTQFKEFPSGLKQGE